MQRQVTGNVHPGSGTLGASAERKRFPRTVVAAAQAVEPATTLTACHGSLDGAGVFERTAFIFALSAGSRVGGHPPIPDCPVGRKPALQVENRLLSGRGLLSEPRPLRRLPVCVSRMTPHEHWTACSLQNSAQSCAVCACCAHFYVDQHYDICTSLSRIVRVRSTPRNGPLRVVPETR